VDLGTLQGIGTALAMVAFISVCLWAYSAGNRRRFDDAAQLPFADDLRSGGAGADNPVAPSKAEKAEKAE